MADLYAYISADLRALAVPLSELNADPANARKHGERNFNATKSSLARFGQRMPIVVRKSGMVVEAGNLRLECARALGWTHIAAVVVDDDAVTATAYGIADNRTAELAEWDDNLGALLASLREEEEDLDALGWSDAELDEILARDAADLGDDEAQGDVDDVPDAPVEVITERGDVWLLGTHRLMCGDSTSAADVSRLMDGDRVGVVFTSPPYDNQRTYDLEGKFDWPQLMRGIADAFDIACKDDAQILVNLGLIRRDGELVEYWRPFIEDMRSRGYRLFDWYVWDAGYPTPGNFGGHLNPCHEWVFHFNRKSSPTLKVRQNKTAGGVKLSGSGPRDAKGELQRMTEVIVYNDHSARWSVASVTKAPHENKEGHPAPFPVGLPEYFVSSWSGSVFEPFSGSGTTIAACENLGRRCYAMEINPAYVDIAVRRWEKLTGRTAERVSK